MPFDMPLCRFENEWKGNLNCNICHIGLPPPFSGAAFVTNTIRYWSIQVHWCFEIHMCMCVCVLFVCFFFKSNLSALESKECRLENQRACRQTNTLKLSRAQRQPNYAKPGGWFIWAHLQSLPVVVQPCTLLQTAGPSGREPAGHPLEQQGEEKSIKVCWLKEPFAWFAYISNP